MGSVFLLAGCDSSYSQQSPSDENLGEDDQNNNEENTENGDESNLDNGQDNEDGTELNQGEDESENDDEVSAQTDHNFYLIAHFRTSSTSVVKASTSLSSSYPQQAFNVTWCDSNGIIDWGNTPTVNSGGSTGSGYVTVKASYFHYSYSKLLSWKRYAYITVNSLDDYDLCATLTEDYTWSDNSAHKGTSYGGQYYYTGGTTLVPYPIIQPTDAVKGTVSFLFRKNYKINYYYWTSPGTYSSSVSATDTMLAGDGVTLRDSVNTIDGYTFVGWSTSKNGSVTYSPGYSLPDSSANANKTFYAIYAPKINLCSYYTSNYSTFTGPSSTGGTIEFSYTNTSGSSASASPIYNSSYNVAYNTRVALRANAKSGYTFRGWYSSIPTASNSPRANASWITEFYPTTASPYNYYALFVQSQSISMYNRYTTNYDTISSGGTGGSIKASYYNTSNSYTSSTITSSSGSITSVYSKTVTLTATAKSGYKFVGWYSAEPSVSSESTSRFSTSTSYSFTASARSSIYGLFAKTYTLTIKYASGNYTHSTTITATNSTIGLSQTISSGNTSGNTYTLTTYCRPNSQTITIARVNGSYTYYMGNGSATTSSSTNSFTYPWSTTADATINVYVREQYKITYNGNGNTGGSVSGSNPTLKAHGLNATLSTNNFTKTGYTANGWNKNTAGTGTHYNNGESYSGNANVTLYAQWTANTYYVKFNGNGSTSGSMSNQTFTYDKAQNLTANAFSKTGYSFAGWATTASGSVEYTDKQSVKNLTTSNGATVNLYAKWNTVSYTITYNGNGGNTPKAQVQEIGAAEQLMQVEQVWKESMAMLHLLHNGQQNNTL